MARKKSPSGDSKGITDKRQAFAEQYIVDWNGTRAAIAAGYSKKTAYVQACRLLKDPEVQAYISEAQKKLAQLAGLSALGLLLELKAIAFADMKDFSDFDKDGARLKPSLDLTPAQSKAIAEVSMTAHGVKLKLHDKLGATAQIAKMLGFNAPDQLDLNVVKTHEDALAELE